MFKQSIQKQKRARKNKDTSQGLGLVLMTLPMMLVVAVFSYLPMGGLIVAFKNYSYRDGIIKSPFCDPLWKNFEFLLKSPDTFRIIRNTILYNLAFIVLTLVISVALAIALNELRSRKALKVYQTTMFIPYFLSWVVISYIVYAFLNPSGLSECNRSPQRRADFGLVQYPRSMDCHYHYFADLENGWNECTDVLCQPDECGYVVSGSRCH